MCVLPEFEDLINTLIYNIEKALAAVNHFFFIFACNAALARKLSAVNHSFFFANLIIPPD